MKIKTNQSQGADIFSQTNVFSVTGETQEVLVQNHFR